MLNPSTLDLQESAQPSPVSPNERPATQPALHVQPPNLAEPPNLPSLLGGAGRENEKRPAGRVRPNFETPQGSEESGSPMHEGYRRCGLVVGSDPDSQVSGRTGPGGIRVSHLDFTESPGFKPPGMAKRLR